MERNLHQCRILFTNTNLDGNLYRPSRPMHTYLTWIHGIHNFNNSVSISPARSITRVLPMKVCFRSSYSLPISPWIKQNNQYQATRFPLIGSLCSSSTPYTAPETSGDSFRTSFRNKSYGPTKSVLLFSHLIPKKRFLIISSLWRCITYCRS